jgi:hypothetical protein
MQETARPHTPVQRGSPLRASCHIPSVVHADRSFHLLRERREPREDEERSMGLFDGDRLDGPGLPR